MEEARSHPEKEEEWEETVGWGRVECVHVLIAGKGRPMRGGNPALRLSALNAGQP